jgi:hypothetical protein
LIDSRSDEEVDSSDHSYDDGLKLLTETHHYQADAEDDMAAIVLASLPRLVTCIHAHVEDGASHDSEHDGGEAAQQRARHAHEWRTNCGASCQLTAAYSPPSLNL